MQTIQHKEIRYRILKAMLWNHPNSLSERYIYLSLRQIFPGISEANISSEMAYLRDGKYIGSEKVFDKPTREKMWLHRIMKPGIDFLEGTLSDPGIDNPEAD